MNSTAKAINNDEYSTMLARAILSLEKKIKAELKQQNREIQAEIQKVLGKIDMLALSAKSPYFNSAQPNQSGLAGKAELKPQNREIQPEIQKFVGNIDVNALPIKSTSLNSPQPNPSVLAGNSSSLRMAILQNNPLLNSPQPNYPLLNSTQPNQSVLAGKAELKPQNREVQAEIQKVVGKIDMLALSVKSTSLNSAQQDQSVLTGKAELKPQNQICSEVQKVIGNVKIDVNALPVKSTSLNSAQPSQSAIVKNPPPPIQQENPSPTIGGFGGSRRRK